MAQVGSSKRTGKLTPQDEERLRKGMNKSGASKEKRAHKQADHASGRRDAAPYQHGLIAPPPPEADWSNKRKSVQGKATAKKAAPAKAASEPRQDVNKEMIKEPGVRSSRTTANVRKVTTSAVQKAMPGSGRPSGAKASDAKHTLGQSARGLKRSPR